MQRTIAWMLALAFAFAAPADSLFTKQAAREGTLISDKKVKFEVGDIITVLVRERINAQTKSDTDTKKESDVQAQAPIAANPFLVNNPPNGIGAINSGELPNWGIEMENEHRTQGKTARANTLETTIACTVTEVLENGNVRIEGKKRVTVNREDSLISVAGLVRSRDVSPGNTINSTQIADAEVQLVGKGPLWNNQRRGLLTKFLDWFSPF